MRPTVHSLYWPGMPYQITEGQKRVFDTLGVPLKQYRENVEPGVWMDRIVREASDDALLVFADVDAFPMRTESFDAMVLQAAQGCLVGLAQANVHFPGDASDQEDYAGPSFMAFTKETWVRAGRPSLQRTKWFDVAQLFSILAREEGIPLFLIRPSKCDEARWKLKEGGEYGIGTEYGGGAFFHLFESRTHKNLSIFEDISRRVVWEKLEQNDRQESNGPSKSN